MTTGVLFYYEIARTRRLNVENYQLAFDRVGERSFPRTGIAPIKPRANLGLTHAAVSRSICKDLILPLSSINSRLTRANRARQPDVDGRVSGRSSVNAIAGRNRWEENEAADGTRTGLMVPVTPAIFNFADSHGSGLPSHLRAVELRRRYESRGIWAPSDLTWTAARIGHVRHTVGERIQLLTGG